MICIRIYRRMNQLIVISVICAHVKGKGQLRHYFLRQADRSGDQSDLPLAEAMVSIIKRVLTA